MRFRFIRLLWVIAVVASASVAAQKSASAQTIQQPVESLPAIGPMPFVPVAHQEELPAEGEVIAAPPGAINQAEAALIDLPSALQLAGVQNPELFVARQRVMEAVALRQLAAAQILPNLNIGASYNDHTGAIQQSSGNIIELHRQAMYVGAGANAVGAGTVTVPGLQYNLNLSQSIFGFLTARQLVRTRQFDNAATRNNVLLQVATAYVELLRAEGQRAIAVRVRDEAAEVARLTANFARTGEGRKSDADRAATELAQREADLARIEGNIFIASSRLCQLLNLDPSTRLHATDGWVVPASLVPEAIPLPELLAMALLNRPELNARRSAVREALLSLDGARLLPFSPQVFLGFSAGGFGGGSNRQDLGAQSNFSGLSDRADFDVAMFWTLQNLGLGNRAQIDAAAARLGASSYQQLVVLNQVRFEVASARARIEARFAQLGSAEQAAISASQAFEEDLNRIRAREGLPIEVLDSLRLVSRSQIEYLNTICDYNLAHFDLYVALGQPPADVLARPAPAATILPPAQ